MQLLALFMQDDNFVSKLVEKNGKFLIGKDVDQQTPIEPVIEFNTEDDAYNYADLHRWEW